MTGTLLATFVLVLGEVACASRPDIRGDNDEARAWAEQQRREEEAERQRWKERARSHPTAKPEPRSELPSSAPPPVARARAPAATSPNAASSKGLLGQGTCFAIDGSGTIVTAHHVIRGSRNVAVKFAEGEPAAARVVQVSEATDLAILKIATATPSFLSLGAPRSARLGMPVFTIGFPNPELLGVAPKYTDGAVSALSGYGDEATLLQTSVPVQPGNSGGPLIDEHGQVVGVMIARAAELPFLRKTGTLPQNVNFATKVENLTPLLRSAPAVQPKAANREQAIERAERAVCIVLAELAE